MKKIAIALLALLVLIIGIMLWVVSSTNAKHLEQQEITVDLPDTFEK